MIIYLQTIDNPADKAKFEQLYLHYQAFMYQVAFQILQNKQDAEDAVHNAFLSIAKNMEKVPPLDKFLRASFLPADPACSLRHDLYPVCQQFLLQSIHDCISGR